MLPCGKKRGETAIPPCAKDCLPALSKALVVVDDLPDRGSVKEEKIRADIVVIPVKDRGVNGKKCLLLMTDGTEDRCVIPLFDQGQEAGGLTGDTQQDHRNAVLVVPGQAQNRGTKTDRVAQFWF